MFSNSILRRGIESYEKEPSGTLVSTIKDIVERVETELLGIKYLLDNRQEVYNSILCWRIWNFSWRIFYFSGFTEEN